MWRRQQHALGESAEAEWDAPPPVAYEPAESVPTP
jgi:hypothetical protein